LRGRIAVHPGDEFNLGQKFGSETFSLVVQNMPSHSHTVNNDYVLKATTSIGDRAAASEDSNPARAWPRIYSTSVNNVEMEQMSIGGEVGTTGAGQPANNMQPFLAVNHAIALQGLFPSRN